MAEIKKNFTKGRMNLDLDDRLLPQGEYREALNIQISGSENSDVGSVKNILGNRLAYLPIDGIPTNQTCVGGIVDEKNDQIYWLITGGYVVDTNLVNGDLEDSDGFVTYTQEDWNDVDTSGLITNDKFLIIADGTGLTYDPTATPPVNPQTDHGITIVAGVAVRDNTNNGTNSSLRQDVEIVDGVTYRVSYRRKYVSGNSTTNIFIDFGSGNQGIASSSETSGSYVTVEDTFVAGYTGTMQFRMYFIGDFVGEIDDIVIEAIEDKASRILRYTPSTDVVEPVFIDVGNEVLKFDASNYITGINIVDDFLFFTDGVNEPKKINIPVCVGGADADDPYFTQTQIAGVDATEEHITVIKKKPTRAPEMFLVRQDAPSNFGSFNDFTFLNSPSAYLASPNLLVLDEPP
jgi:hypothetical protein